MAHPISALLAKAIAIALTSAHISAEPKVGHALTYKAMSVSGPATSLPIAGRKATVLVFVAHDCPVCNVYAPELMRIYSAYRPKGIAMYVVYAEKDFSPAQAKAHAKAYGLTCGLLRDPDYTLAHKMDAHITPEAVVMTPDGNVAYRGRIDDHFVTFGMARAHVANHDLRKALDAVLDGKAPDQSTGKAVGCAIP